MRTRLAARVWERTRAEASATSDVLAACVAAEILHTATLCHDDLVDRSPRRRHHPSVWADLGVGVAVLLGDLLLAEAVTVIEESAPARTRRFLGVMKEMGLSELGAEMAPRGAPLGREAWIAHNRAKTGALFSFVASACGEGDAPLCRALEEAGYGIGTGYQVLDDVVDVAGDESRTGKPRGVDQARGFLTPAQEDPEGCVELALSHWNSACASLSAWPSAREALEDYLVLDVLPLFRDVLAGSPLEGRLTSISARA